MKVVLFVFVLLIPSFALCRDSLPDILLLLDEAIENRDYFVGKKLARIDQLKREFAEKGNQVSLNEQFDCFRQLSNEYLTLKFDSALAFAGKLVAVAEQLDDQDKLCQANTEYANILISAGIFNESITILKSIDIRKALDRSKAFYYTVLSRGYFDMESFSQNPHFASNYREKGMASYDSALVYLPATSWEYLSIQAQKNIKLGKTEEATELLNKLIYNYQLSNDQIAIQLMSLAFTCNILGNREDALKHMAEASIADFRGAKKEAVALLFTANYLFEQGDIIRASKYINVALEDSRYYGSNFRLWQVSQFLPLIKSEHITTIEKQKKQLWYSLILETLLTLIVVVSLIIIFYQIRKLRKSKLLVESINKKLISSNEDLTLANKIKEEYVGYYFAVSSQIIENMDKFKRSVKKKAQQRQYDELLTILENFNINHEKKKLFDNFDKAFLNIFPDFISKFNMLLKEGEELHPKEGHLLNNELRLYALVRLGIHDSEKIASILDYSINTIYAYKSKIKSKARMPQTFEKEVMEIKRY